MGITGGAHSNWALALVEAACAASDARAGQRGADVTTAVSLMGTQEECYKAWRMSLSPGQQFVDRPKSFQSSWMSMGKLESMVQSERQDLEAQLASWKKSLAADRKKTSTLSDGSATNRAQAYVNALESVLGKFTSAKTPSEAKKGFAVLVAGETGHYSHYYAVSSNGGYVQHSVVSFKLDCTSKIDASYLSHKVSKATLAELGDNVTDAVNYAATLSLNSSKLNAAQDAIVGAQALLRQGQTDQQNVTDLAAANAGAGQNQVNQDANQQSQDLAMAGQMVSQVNSFLEGLVSGTW